VDHNAVVGTCSSCHNGSVATGKPQNHIPTTGECDTCHSTVAWTPARFDHATITGSCASCHNGGTATGKPSNHFVTNLACETCHRNTGWTPLIFRHSSLNFPDHGSRLDCKDCHRANAQQVPYPSPAFAPDCAACHANDFKPGPHKKYEQPTKVTYTVQELRDCTGACHVYTDSSLTTINKRRSNEHSPNRGGW
jgi:hypothetical protein